jgi:hypothetical protein
VLPVALLTLLAGKVLGWPVWTTALVVLGATGLLELAALMTPLPAATTECGSAREPQ